MRYAIMEVSSASFGIRDTDPCGDGRAPLWRVDNRAPWLAGSRDVAGAYVTLLNAENTRVERVAYNKCHEVGCEREAMWAGEPGDDERTGYSSTCSRCFDYVGYRGHVHAHGYWPEYIAAHPGTSTDAYMRTSSLMRPIVTDDVVTGYRCADIFCGYTVDQARYEARISRWYGGVKTWGVFDHVTHSYVIFGDEKFTTTSEDSARFFADTFNG